MKSNQANAELIESYMSAAREALAAGQYTLDGGFSGVAAARAYYACFYAASPLLQTRDVTRSKPSGVLSAFRQYFVKPGIIESEYSDLYGEAFDARHVADYDMIGTFDPEEAQKTLKNARRFVVRTETYLSEAGYRW